MRRVGHKGQVVIDRDIRAQLAIQPGWETIQRIVDGRVEITFLPPPRSDSLRGCLAPLMHGPGGRGRDFGEIREAAWRQAIEDGQQA